MSAPYLKFASPLLDEATIAGVGDVLRSGHITSGPWVERFERCWKALGERAATAGRPTVSLSEELGKLERLRLDQGLHEAKRLRAHHDPRRRGRGRAPGKALPSGLH